MKYVPYDFIKTNKILLTMNEKNMWQDISGNKETTGEFVILNFYGQKEFINYKSNELKSIIHNYGKDAFKKTNNVFKYMCNEAIREILNECRNKGIISFNDDIFRFYDDRLEVIIYDNIKVITNTSLNDDKQNETIVYGTYINQQGNNNIANVSSSSDEKLFELLANKLESIKIEMKNNNCDDKLKELEKAIEKRDKSSVLDILSNLASIGSFIASMFIK